MYYWDIGMGTYLLFCSAPTVPGNRFLKTAYLILGCWMVANAGIVS